MKTTLQKVREGIAAALLGKTREQLEEEQLKDAVKSAVDDYLIRHPDWKPSPQPSPKAKPTGQRIKDTKQKAKRIMKIMGAGAGVFTPHVVDEAALARARAKCREIVTANPAAYSYIIESAPLRDDEQA